MREGSERNLNSTKPRLLDRVRLSSLFITDKGDTLTSENARRLPTQLGDCLLVLAAARATHQLAW